MKNTTMNQVLKAAKKCNWETVRTPFAMNGKIGEMVTFLRGENDEFSLDVNAGDTIADLLKKIERKIDATAYTNAGENYSELYFTLLG